jgi:hypothetical protein
MSVRSDLAKLRQQAGEVRADSVVKAISDLMDELSFEASGGGALRQQSSLQDAFDDAHPPAIRSNDQ